MTDEGKRSIWYRLYNGETSYDFVGRYRLWFAFSGVVIAVGIASLALQGLNLGIDFKGGTAWEVPVKRDLVEEARDTLAGTGLGEPKIQLAESSSGKTLKVQTRRFTGTDAEIAAKQQEVSDRLGELAGVEPGEVNVTDVGPSFGRSVANKARTALIVFLVVITIYISLRFEWKMAVAAMAAVVHDILVTVGVYSLSRFEVTPATVVAFLTILGYSLYDTIVVFDKVEENTKGLSASGRMTYADTVNLSMNQVLMRSLNTSLVAILPILSVLVIGAYGLGATTLKDFGLALLIGLLTGAYSSIYVASPILALLKEREPRYAALRQRLAAKPGPTASTPLTPAAAAMSRASAIGEAGDGDKDRDRVGVRAPAPPRARPSSTGRPANRPPPRPRKKGKRR
jgi:preprotein translocase subunit SecF